MHIHQNSITCVNKSSLYFNETKEVTTTPINSCYDSFGSVEIVFLENLLLSRFPVELQCETCPGTNTFDLTNFCTTEFKLCKA